MRTDKLHIGTNTKMYKGTKDTVNFIQELVELTADISLNQIELFVIPSFTSIERAVITAQDRISIGAQNMHWENEGQFTGEISPKMLTEIGTRIAEIGHSERRHIFNETDQQENKKVLAALSHGLTPLLCIGESAEHKHAGASDAVLEQQLRLGLHSVDEHDAQKLWIAYEPVWAIGVNGTPASKEYVNERHSAIKRILSDLFGQRIGTDIPVLYGGSVNNDNASELICLPHVDGLFIGRSAWDSKNFNNIIRDVLPLFNKKRHKEL